MIFLGDIASPNILSSELLNKVISENKSVFNGKRIICNFEGLIYDGTVPVVDEPVLYNHSSVLNVFSPERNHILCLANNHILDMPEQFGTTKSLINEKGFFCCGAGITREESETPIIYSEGKRTFALFNACWNFLLYNHKNPRSGIYVSELKEERLIEQIQSLKVSSPGISILIYLHWSLDLEKLPFPMYRQFSRALIDAGALLVAGTHAHCVQGGEKYNDGYIIYGLGNFLIPDNEYAGGMLKFPEFSRLTLAFELDEETNSARCHWFESGLAEKLPDLKFLGSDDFESSKTLNDNSPFLEMSDNEYFNYYKSNRRKKFLIPVYRDFRQRNLNRLYTRFLIVRATLAHFLARLHFIKWQN